MLVDAKVAFVPIGVPLSLVAAAGVDIVSPLVYDFLGSGVGTPVNNIYGNPALPGQADAMGVGPQRPELVVLIGTALVANTGTPLLTVELQAAPDNGANLEGTYQTLVRSGPVTVAQGVAGARIARFPWVPPFPVNLRPRFMRLNFEIPAGTNFSAGTIQYAGVTTTPDDLYQLQAARNYTALGVG